MMVAEVSNRRLSSSRRASFFSETEDLPRYDQHGFVSRHVSEKALEAGWSVISWLFRSA